MSSECVPASPAAATLADFTDSGLIIPQLRGGETASTIQELTEVLQSGRRLPDVLPFYQAALNREFLASTEMETGMAFPHARMAGLKEVTFALGRSGEPLRWGPQAACTVRLVFLLAVPATDATQYLSVLSGLVRLSKDADLMARLLSAQGALPMLEVLRQVGLRSHARSDVARTGAT